MAPFIEWDIIIVTTTLRRSETDKAVDLIMSWQRRVCGWAVVSSDTKSIKFSALAKWRDDPDLHVRKHKFPVRQRD